MGNPDQTDLVKLEDGEFWVDDIKRISSASLTLRRSSKKSSTRAFELFVSGEGESSIFSLDNSTNFKRGELDIVWKPESHSKTFKFVLKDEEMKSTLDMFHLACCQCLYEVIHDKSFNQATDEQLKELMSSTSSIKEKPLPFDGTVVFESEESLFYLFDPASNMFVIPSSSSSSSSKKSNEQNQQHEKDEKHHVNDEESNRSKALILKDPQGTFYFRIVDLDGKVLHHQLIDPDATLHTDRSSYSFIWCYFAPEGQVWTFSQRFSSVLALMALSNAMGQTIYEILNSESIKKAESDYLLSPFMEDIEMQNIKVESEEEGSSDDSNLDSGSDDSHQGYSIREKQKGLLSSSSDSDGDSSDAGEQYSQLAVGYKHERSFATKGKSIGVFKHTEDDKLKLHAKLDTTIATKDGKSFAPSKIMLHNEDNSLLLMNPENSHSIYRMDLERGSIVDEWNIHPDAPVNTIIPDTKYAQMTDTQTFIGLNSNSLFRIDPRLSGNKRVDEEMKQYVVPNKFTCGATTGKGELAVASAKGEIRLFNKLDKRAKTLLPGFGDPIIGVDVTESGRYVIATCKTYLLLICTEIPGQDSLGFTKSMGREKPAPKRLTLRPEHVAFMSQPINFTTARFSTGQSEERSIITSTGPYVITWNFRRVKQGHLYDYQIKKYADKVVADNFRFGQDKNIVVALPHNITMISKKNMSVPSPKVFRGEHTQGGKEWQ